MYTIGTLASCLLSMVFPWPNHLSASSKKTPNSSPISATTTDSAIARTDVNAPSTRPAPINWPHKPANSSTSSRSLATCTLPSNAAIAFARQTSSGPISA